jgi:hypothetical protein
MGGGIDNDEFVYGLANGTFQILVQLPQSQMARAANFIVMARRPTRVAQIPKTDQTRRQWWWWFLFRIHSAFVAVGVVVGGGSGGVATLDTANGGAPAIVCGVR